MVTIKSKFIVENQTGAPLEIKQRGTPDLDETPTTEERCARMLLHEQRWGICCLDRHNAVSARVQAACAVLQQTVCPLLFEHNGRQGDGAVALAWPSNSAYAQLH